MKNKGKIFGIVPIEVLLDKRLSLNDFRVFVAISSFQGKKDKCWSSLEKIAERSSVRKNHISKHTKRLEEFGYIKIVRRGKRISNVYYVKNYYMDSDYPTSGDSDYPPSGYSDYPPSGESNNKTTIKTTMKTTSSEEEVIFKNKYFEVTKEMLREWKETYPYIVSFKYELTGISDVITEKERRGEKIKSPMRFLHTHLKNLNKKNHESKCGGYQNYNERNYHSERSGSEPKVIGDLIHSILNEYEN